MGAHSEERVVGSGVSRAVCLSTMIIAVMVCAGCVVTSRDRVPREQPSPGVDGAHVIGPRDMGFGAEVTAEHAAGGLDLGDVSSSGGTGGGNRVPVTVSVSIASVDVVSEITVTSMTTPTFNTATGAQLTFGELETLYATEPHNAVLASAIYRLGDLKAGQVFSGTTGMYGFVVYLAGGSIGDVEWSPDGGDVVDPDSLVTYPHGVVLLSSAEDLAAGLDSDGAPRSPLLDALLDRAEELSQGEVEYLPMFAERWFQFVDGYAVDERSGFSMPLNDFMDLIADACK